MSDSVKKSIWDEDGPSKYKNEFVENEQPLSVLRYVENAKKQTGVLSVDDLRLIWTSIEAVPKDPTADDIQVYLQSTCGIDGVGIPIAICMLSRMRPSEFPPFDKFVLSGLFKSDEIDEEMFKVLEKKNIKTFSAAYVSKMIQLWKSKLMSGQLPSEIDKHWIVQGKSS
jgi:hypothetical protein